MCVVCDLQGRGGRRSFFRQAGGSALGAALTAGLPGWALASGGPTTSVTPNEALARLKVGNIRYLKNPEVCAMQLAQQRGQTSKGQMPWATIVSCADSRVTPELLFGGVGIGELFVARNAGNMVDTATMGTIEYGSGVLGIPLIVVLGHQKCGAVAAACEVVEKGTKFPSYIAPMVEAIVPAARAVVNKPGDFVENVIRESAIRTARKIATDSPIVADLVAKKKVQVIAGRYDLQEGRVDFFG